MDNFYKIIMPGTFPYGRNNSHVPAHFKVSFIDGTLSISGVIGAKSNGDAWGSAGQCIKELLNPSFRLSDDWTSKNVNKFVDVWEKWHLNDLHPECEHQRAMGWNILAKEEVSLYNWTTNAEALKLKRAAKRAAIDALKAGLTFTPTKEQVFFASLEYSITTHGDALPIEIVPWYEPRKALSSAFAGPIEVKRLGHLRQDEHPDGLLSRACTVCGYKYGTAWKKVEVPDDVLFWLLSLPSASVPCAWHNL